MIAAMGKKGKEEGRRITESYIMGVVALIFLVIGYQISVFVHKAAVLKIEANRDHPDTVYIYAAMPATIKTPNATVEERTAVRKNAGHSKVVMNVRESLPRRIVESFPFNPNTVSENELCRLGFTGKQASSIINYRLKGGRFHRKTDFAKSFVVSDSIYRRLEPYIDIPLVDLNLADSADFDALPGIGGWFASRMVAYRNALQGYSYKEQLMDIWKFDAEKFALLSDLVVVSDEHKKSYPLWTYPADSLARHPYIRNLEVARSIVRYRENTPKEKWSVEGLERAGILSHETASKICRCTISCP